MKITIDTELKRLVQETAEFFKRQGAQVEQAGLVEAGVRDYFAAMAQSRVE